MLTKPESTTARILIALCFLFSSFFVRDAEAEAKQHWTYTAPRPNPGIQFNGKQLVSDGAGGVVALFEDNNSGDQTVVWINRLGRVIFKKSGILNGSIFAAEQNAVYILGLTEPTQAEPSVLAVSRKGEETDVDSIQTFEGALYFNFDDRFATQAPLSRPTDNRGFFAFAPQDDTANEGSPPLLKIVRILIR